MSIRLVLRRGAGLVAALGLLAGLGAEAPSAQAAQAVTCPEAARWHVAGCLYERVGVPTSAKRGQSIVVSLWTMQNSPDTMQVSSAALLLACQERNSASTGVRVDWLDPFTHRWEPTTGSWLHTPYSHYWTVPPQYRLMYRPGVWGHIYARITFTSKARLGKWWVYPNTPWGYEMWKAGAPVGDDLVIPSPPTGAYVSVHA